MFIIAGTAKRTRYDDALGPRMLTVQDVARLLHIHANTVRRWSDLGLLKTYRIGHRRDRRFAPQDVSQFLESTNKEQDSSDTRDLALTG